MVKGDADRSRQAKRDAFTKKYKAGDFAFSPIYGAVKIMKMNKTTATCKQVSNAGSLVPGEILIDKSYFTW